MPIHQRPGITSHKAASGKTHAYYTPYGWVQLAAICWESCLATTWSVTPAVWHSPRQMWHIMTSRPISCFHEHSVLRKSWKETLLSIDSINPISYLFVDLVVEPPIWEICKPSKWIISPRFRDEKKHVLSCHHLVMVDWNSHNNMYFIQATYTYTLNLNNNI